MQVCFFNAMQVCFLMKILSHASAKKKTKWLRGFKIHTLNGGFQVTSGQ